MKLITYHHMSWNKPGRSCIQIVSVWMYCSLRYPRAVFLHKRVSFLFLFFSFECCICMFVCLARRKFLENLNMFLCRLIIIALSFCCFDLTRCRSSAYSYDILADISVGLFVFKAIMARMLITIRLGYWSYLWSLPDFSSDPPLKHFFSS